MKKLSLLFAICFVFLFSATAQENDGKNFFLGIGVQGNVYGNNETQNEMEAWKMPSLGGNLFLGKWFSRKVGARVLFEGGTLHPFFQDRKVMVDQKYLGGRLDFMLNLTNLFRSYSPDRFYNMIPYIGGGYAYAFDAVKRPDKLDNFSSILVGGGLLNTFRLSNTVSAFLNLGANAVDPKFDGHANNYNKIANFIFSPSVGLVFNFGKSPKQEIIPPPVAEPYVAPPAPQPQPQPQPRPEPPKVEPAKTPFASNVFFRLNKSVIDANQQAAIANAADFLKANPSLNLKVVGYADKLTGKPAYNLQLSERRAKNVANELVKKYNINSNRLRVEWKGDTSQPFAVNEQNRVVMLFE